MSVAPRNPPSSSNNNNNNNRIKRLATQVFVGAYQGVTSAYEIERLITNEEWDAKEIICTNMAIATKDIAGCTKIRELGNPAALEAAASGAILGGLIGGMSQLMIGASKRPSVIQSANDPDLYEEEKAFVASKRPSILAKVATNNIGTMDKGRLHKIGTALIPGSSAIICVFDEVLIKQTDYDKTMQDHHDEMSDLTDHVVTKITDNLRSGNDIAFHIIVDESTGDISWTRTVIGDEAIQVRDIVMSHDSVAVEEVTTANNVTVDEYGDIIEKKNPSNETLTTTTVITPESIATARTLLRNSVTAYEISYEDLLDDDEKNVHAGDQVYETGVLREHRDGTRDVEYEKSTIHGEETTYEHQIKLGGGRGGRGGRGPTELMETNTNTNEKRSSTKSDPPGEKQLRLSTTSLAPFDERREDSEKK